MRKVTFKGRCTKRKLSKCKDICRTYDQIQTAFADVLEQDPDIKSFCCNVRLASAKIVIIKSAQKRM